MKNLLTTLILAASTCLSTCYAGNYDKQGHKCPIKKETTAIRYTVASNSGIGTQTEYDITPDSVTWRYIDYRNGFTLSDVVKHDKKDYDALIDILSQVEFKVHRDNSIPSTGGGGYAYAFFDSNGTYLNYGVVNNIASGDNKTAEEAISQFLDTHRTTGEQAVKEALENGMLHIDIEEFPETLVPYRVK